MNKNIEFYVFQYSNFLDKETCENVLKEIKNLKWEEHRFYNLKEKKYNNLSGEQELDSLYNLQSIPIIDALSKKLWFAIDKYVTSLNFKWFQGWQGYSSLKFNRYSLNKKMAEHCDHARDLFDGTRRGIPMLSVVGLLNDDFKGGEFVMFRDVEIKLKRGDLLIFPSNFVYPHRVDPVTEGTRYSFVSWVW
jgi:predicted 2-oxoglutarate/Fe(II)-dependent dioxygenase YbiX